VATEGGNVEFGGRWNLAARRRKKGAKSGGGGFVMGGMLEVKLSLEED